MGGGEINDVFGINLVIFEDDEHIFGVVGAGVVQSLHLVRGIDGWRPSVFLFTERRTTANGASEDQTTDLEQRGVVRRGKEQQSVIQLNTNMDSKHTRKAIQSNPAITDSPTEYQ